MSAVVQLIRPETDREEWAARISAAWQKSVEGIFEAAQLLIKSKGSLAHGEFMAMIKEDLPFGVSTADKLMAIAKDRRIKSEHVPILPPNWGTIHAVTTLNDDEFHSAFERGIIHPAMDRKDLRSFKRELRKMSEDTLAKTVTPTCEIHHCAIENVSSDLLADASVDAIITDPPYPPKFLQTFSHLSAFAERVLKPGGWCVVMTGAVFLPEVINRLSKHLTYRWQYVITTPGGANARIGSLGLFQGYKPVLLFQKPPVAKIREWWSDVITLKTVNGSEQDKVLHKWQQPQLPFDELVNRFSRPGELVVDPFAGSGTTGRAAVSQGRHFWGCDIDPECATEKRKLKEPLE